MMYFLLLRVTGQASRAPGGNDLSGSAPALVILRHSLVYLSFKTRNPERLHYWLAAEIGVFPWTRSYRPLHCYY